MITMQWVKYWVNKVSSEGWRVTSDVQGENVRFQFRAPSGRLFAGQYHPDTREAYCNALAQVARHFTELPL